VRRVSIIYICTGSYSSLWADFYRSAESYFLPRHSKIYHIFTDNLELTIKVKKTVNCVPHTIKHEPWPWPSLNRFQYITDIHQELIDEGSEICVFINANAFFHQTVELSELGLSENCKFVGVQHPGYSSLHSWLCPYERRTALSCYVPWSYRGAYLQGCLQGGYTQDFIKMAQELSTKTKTDTGQKLLARWHDESYWNHWASKNRVRVLPPIYASPWEISSHYPEHARILMRVKPAGFRPSNGKPQWLRKPGVLVRAMVNRVLKRYRP